VVIGDRAGFIANALLFGYPQPCRAHVREPLRHKEDLDAPMRTAAAIRWGVGMLD